MSTSIMIRHNFETAHRLPHLGGKCTNVHGHSWWAEVTVTGPELPDGTVAEFGVVKSAVRGWIDQYLDHAVMLGCEDPLVDVLANYGCVFVFGRDNPTRDLWPTVEAVARLLYSITADLIDDSLSVDRVWIQETHVNEAGVSR